MAIAPDIVGIAADTNGKIEVETYPRGSQSLELVLQRPLSDDVGRHTVRICADHRGIRAALDQRHAGLPRSRPAAPPRPGLLADRAKRGVIVCAHLLRPRVDLRGSARIRDHTLD